MEEVKIKTDAGEKTIKMPPLKGGETKEGFKLYTSIAKQDQEDLSALNTYLDWLDKLTSEKIGMSIKELDNLYDDEKNKLTGYYQEKITGKIAFLRSSLK